MAGLNKEVWISLLLGANEAFWANDWFIKMGVDMSAYVEGNEYVNFAHKGSAPTVTKNPTYPLATTERTDVADKLPMNNYSTTRFQLPKFDLMKLAYDKKDSVLKDHREALINQIGTEGIWNVSPYQNTASTPVINATGSAGSDTYKTISSDDIMALRVKLDVAYPALKNAKWILVMDAISFWALVNSDSNLKGQIQNQGKVGEVNVMRIFYYGFEIVMDNRTPYYTSSNVRVAFGATVNTAGGDRPSATAFVDQKSFASAVGEVKMFIDEDDSAYQADFGSFAVPALITPFSQDLATNLKFLGAIIRKT